MNKCASCKKKVPLGIHPCALCEGVYCLQHLGWEHHACTASKELMVARELSKTWSREGVRSKHGYCDEGGSVGA